MNGSHRTGENDEVDFHLMPGVPGAFHIEFARRDMCS